jgi:CBS domain-containing protein
MGPDDVGTPSPDDVVGDAADALESEGVGALVVTENGEPVGMVTDRDVARSVTTPTTSRPNPSRL